jgi:fucose permease
VIFIVFVILAILIYFSTLPEIDTNKKDAVNEDRGGGQTSIFQFPHLLLGVVTLFFYVGVEVLAGDSVISYGASQGIALSTAKFFTTCTLSCMIAGYIVGIICIPRYFSQETALRVCAFIGLIFSLCALFTSGLVSVMFIALLGIANSLMWPALWPLAINGLGKFTKIGSSMLIMGIAGAALIPLLYGFIVDQLMKGGEVKSIAATQAYWILVPCYLIIAYYAISGHKLKPKNVFVASDVL